MSLDFCLLGYCFNTTTTRPTLWTEAFPACVALEPSLPDDEGTVGVQEVELDDVQVKRFVMADLAPSAIQYLGGMAPLLYGTGFHDDMHLPL